MCVGQGVCDASKRRGRRWENVGAAVCGGKLYQESIQCVEQRESIRSWLKVREGREVGGGLKLLFTERIVAATADGLQLVQWERVIEIRRVSAKEFMCAA